MSAEGSLIQKHVYIGFWEDAHRPTGNAQNCLIADITDMAPVARRAIPAAAADFLLETVAP
jgi:hypothetical protein